VNESHGSQPGVVFDAVGNLYARGNHANIGYAIDGVPAVRRVVHRPHGLELLHGPHLYQVR
jgi:hypothetical protein